MYAEVEPNTMGTALYNSKYATAPGASLRGRWRTREVIDEGADNPPVTSSIGRQVTLSTRKRYVACSDMNLIPHVCVSLQATSMHATAPTATFPRLPRLPSPERTFAPNPFSYHPNVDATLPSTPTVKIKAALSGSADDAVASVNPC